MRRFVHLLIPLLTGLLKSASAFALSGIDTLPYTISHYTDENGLPQNSVKFIAPDEEGFLWLATENGLVRFDGDHFRNFNVSSRIAYLYPAATHNGLMARTDQWELIRIEDGQTLWDTRKLSASDDYEFLIYNHTAGVYPVTGLPNVFADIIHQEYYQIPVGSKAYYLIGKDSISFVKEKLQQYRFRYPAPDPWHFFSMGDSLYHLTEKGDVVFFDRDKPVQVVLRCH